MPDLLNAQQKMPPAPARPRSRFFAEYYSSAVSLLIAAFVGIAFFLLRPMITDIKQTNAATAQRLETINEQRAYLASLSQSIAASQAISPEALDEVNRALPSEADIPLLLVQISTAAAQRNIKVGSIAFSELQTPRPGALPPSGKSATSSPAAIPMDVSLTANAQSYVDIKRFLADLEASLRLMDVIGISTSAGAKGKETTYQLQLRTYVFNATKPPTSP